MSQILPYILLLVGFVLLVKGADFFVEGSSSIAKLLKIPSIVIGLTIVAFGTSAPEAAVSISAGLKGANELAVANVVGSNIFNLLVVLGVCSLIKPIKVDKSILIKEYPMSLLAAAALLLMSADVFFKAGTENILTRSDGLILVLFFIIFMYTTVKSALSNRTQETEETTKRHSPLVSGIMSIGGLAGIIIGGQLVVNSASDIAASFGVSQNLIGLTIVAIGTSLPELVTSIVASRKGENEIAVGNVVGSNLFNVFFVLAASASLSPIPVTGESIVDMLVLIGVSLLAYLFLCTGKKIGRVEGGIMAAMYVGYTAYIIMR